MPAASRHREIDAARRWGELTVEQLWLRSLALGGHSGQLEIDAYLHEMLPLPADEETVLAVAVNEQLDELHALSRVACPTRGSDMGGGELDPLDVLEQLLAAGMPTAPVVAAGTPPAPEEDPTADQQLSEALQRSLLTDPVQPGALSLRVRYRSAAAGARIGGDWYDSFLTAGGTTCIVIGDVTGHDRDAAAGMAQTRNLLRGIAYTVEDPPAAVLATLDRAIRDLGVGALATAVLATIEPDGADRDAGVHLLRWSNAGHPPPLLLLPDGSARLLVTDPDLMLGIYPDTDRSDHQQILPPGATVLLYTDGLVERRDAAIDEGLRWLAATARSLAQAPLDELCDTLLNLIGPATEDDVALLALRTPTRADSAPNRSFEPTVFATES
ncbi:MAG TPA: PP2C family protein-serine/threonine phosphatase [Frankiaceae bacterium]|nr:PP2C family protein-serine/threonine phosphatase [Frankiaceae bacterium]